MASAPAVKLESEPPMASAPAVKLESEPPMGSGPVVKSAVASRSGPVVKSAVASRSGPPMASELESELESEPGVTLSGRPMALAPAVARPSGPPMASVPMAEVPQLVAPVVAKALAVKSAEQQADSLHVIQMLTVEYQIARPTQWDVPVSNRSENASQPVPWTLIVQRVRISI